jgi:hypothetical protein
VKKLEAKASTRGCFTYHATIARNLDPTSSIGGASTSGNASRFKKIGYVEIHTQNSPAVET